MQGHKQFLIGIFLVWLFTDHYSFGAVTQNKIDSLNHVIEAAQNDTVRVKTYMELDNLIYASDPVLDKEINQKVLKICSDKLKQSGSLSKKELLFYKKYKGSALNNLAVIAKNQGYLDTALNYNEQSLAMKMETDDKKGIANSYINIGGIYHTKGDLVRALDYYFKCLEIREEIKDEKGIATLYINIGAVYHYQDDYTNASRYYQKSAGMYSQQENEQGVAQARSNLGTVYLEQGDSALKAGNKALAEEKYSQALRNYTDALEIDRRVDFKNGVAKDYNNIGSAYYKKGNPDTALFYFIRSAEIREAIGINTGLASCYYNMANIYYQKGQYSKAMEFGEKSYRLAKQINSVMELNGATAVLHRTYKETGRYKDALQMHEEWVITQDSIVSRERSIQTIQQQYKYEYDKKAAADSIQNAKEQELKDLQIGKQEVELAVQRNKQFALAGGLILVLIFAIIMYNRFKLTTRQKHIIELQKEIVEEKQKEILDSINYAKRIQTAILPPALSVANYLSDHFILYLPKDIVAGDFYWLESHSGKILFAAADCTGHGVPGAMVSVVCNNGLNRSVREHGLTQPGKILDKTREIVIQEFEKSEDEVKDGMDISLCTLNPGSLQLEWAGANNPLWIIRNRMLIEFKPDKQHIGKLGDPVPFTTHHFQLEKSDMLYIFTDGYQDQFGGEKGKKFKTSQLKELLISISNESVEIQKKKLQDVITAWRGPMEQIDDICVMGVRI